MCVFQFVKFANIEEDTPSYHRRYDFFVSKFSSMCHNSDKSTAVRSRYRTMRIWCTEHHEYNGMLLSVPVSSSHKIISSTSKCFC